MFQDRERVQRGAAFLDRIYPGWYRKISPSSLNLYNNDRCVLGQLFGAFGDGMGRVNMEADTYPEANELGFVTLLLANVRTKRLWRKAIEARRRGDQLDVEEEFRRVRRRPTVPARSETVARHLRLEQPKTPRQPSRGPRSLALHHQGS